jgi:hypothetical protein
MVKRRLDPKFWSRFCDSTWEKKPLLLKGVDSPIFELDAAGVFELLVAYSDYCRDKGTVVGVKFYVDGQPQYEDEILRVLPVNEDKSLEGYHARMRKLFSDYCLVCDELMRVSNRKWEVVGNFMRELYAHIGMPNRFCEIGLYLGNYRRTPFGVHVDGCGVFSIPVIGEKVFRLWDPKYVAKNPDLQESRHYGNYKSHSKLLVAKPGDITYWPSTYWHIAESKGRFSATWSIGVWLNRPYSEVLSSTVSQLLSGKIGEAADARTIRFGNSRADGFVEKLPTAMQNSISAILDLSEGELRDAFLKEWLRSVSKNGFKESPVTKPLRLSRVASVRRIAHKPIFWTRLSNSKLCLALNGVLLEFPYSRGVLRIIENLNAGSSCNVKENPKLLRALYGAGGLYHFE